MTNATLWFKINVADTLGGVSTFQKINFNQDTVLLENVRFLPWENNIKFMSNPNPDGDRIINTTDNGGKMIEAFLVIIAAIGLWIGGFLMGFGIRGLIQR